jgi:hypothetical protein
MDHRRVAPVQRAGAAAAATAAIAAVIEAVIEAARSAEGISPQAASMS